MLDHVRKELAPDGTLRVGINLSNTVLVSHRLDDGTPVGVSPDMALSVADQLGVKIDYQCYEQVGLTADAISNGDVAMGLIAHEPERAKTIAFSSPYCEIDGTYLVWEDSPFQTVDDVDQPGVEIAASNRAAYELYLSRTLKHAKLNRATGLPAAARLFETEKLDALSGVRPALVKNALQITGTGVLEDRFMAIKQGLGTSKDNHAAADFLQKFVDDAVANGLAADLIEKHNRIGQLSVPAQ